MRTALAVRLLLSLVSVWICGATSAADGSPAKAAGPSFTTYQSGRWTIRQTSNFRICTTDSQLDVDSLPALCERLKSQMDEVWSPGESIAWSPRCDVLIHASIQQYHRAVGPEAGSSVGCTTLRYDGGRVVTRRIDLRVDASTWQQDALPHELCHVVMADFVGGSPLPPWLDEGLSVLCESQAKRRVRATAYRTALGRRTVYQATALISVSSVPQPAYIDAFYAQSAALVRLLLQRSGPDEFVRFARLTVQDGLEKALRETYQISSMGEFDQLARNADVAGLVSGHGLFSTARITPEDAAE